MPIRARKNPAMQKLAYLALLVALAVTPIACSNAKGHVPAIAAVGQLAPSFLEKTSTGATLTMASLRGKPVYLNFFATWCPPCNAEAPSINALQKKYAGRGLAVVGVDVQESAKAAQGFREKYQLVYPAVVDTGALATAYSINGLPVHVFIARSGIVQKIVIGEMSPAAIQGAIRSIL